MNIYFILTLLSLTFFIYYQLLLPQSRARNAQQLRNKKLSLGSQITTFDGNHGTIIAHSGQYIIVVLHDGRKVVVSPENIAACTYDTL